MKIKCLFCKDRVKMLSLYFNPIKFNVNYTQNKKCSSFENLTIKHTLHPNNYKTREVVVYKNKQR